MSRKARDVPTSNSGRGGALSRSKAQNSSSSKQRTKRPKPLDVQGLIDDALNKSQSEVIARGALQWMIEKSAKTLFDHHVQRVAIDTTSITTIGAVFEATRLCTLKHDAGEKDALFPAPSPSPAGLFEVSSTNTHSNSSESGITQPIQPRLSSGLARLQRIRMAWGDAPNSDDVRAYALTSNSPEFRTQEQEKCTRSPVTSVQQTWVCEAPPPPCAEDRWSRGLAPLHDGTISSHHKPLNTKFSETLVRKQQVVAAVSQALRSQNPNAASALAQTTTTSLSLTSSQPITAAPSGPSSALRNHRRSSISTTSPLSSPASSTSSQFQNQGEIPSAGTTQGPLTASTPLDANAIRAAALRGTEIDLRNVPSDSPLFWKSTVDLDGALIAVPPAVRRRTSMSFSQIAASETSQSQSPQSQSRSLQSSLQPQQQPPASTQASGFTTSSAQSTPQPFAAPPVVSQHKLAEERLREVALKNLSDERKLRTLQAEVDRRLASEATRFSLFRTDLKDKDFTLGRTGAVVLVKTPVATAGRPRGGSANNTTSSLSSNVNIASTDAISGSAPLPSTCPTISAVHVSVHNQGNSTSGRTATTSTTIAGRRAMSGNSTSRAEAQAKDPAATAALTASAASLRLLASTVDPNAVQPPLAQVMQPAAGVTMKQGAVVKVGSKRFASGQTATASSSPYANMSKAQYLQLIQAISPAAPSLPLHSTLSQTPNVVVNSASQPQTLPKSKDMPTTTSALSPASSAVQTKVTQAPEMVTVDKKPLLTAPESRLGGSMNPTPASAITRDQVPEPVEVGYDPQGTKLQAKLQEDQLTSRRELQKAMRHRQRELEQEATLALTARPVNSNTVTVKESKLSKPSRSPRTVVEALANEPGRGTVPYGKQQPIRTRERKPPLAASISGHSSTGILQTGAFGTLTTDSLNGNHRGSQERLQDGDIDVDAQELQNVTSLASSRNIVLPYRHVVTGLHHSHQPAPLTQPTATAALSGSGLRGPSKTLVSTGSAALQAETIVTTSLAKYYFGPQTVSTSATGSQV